MKWLSDFLSRLFGVSPGPKYHCPIYRECAHVDGPLRDVRTCRERQDDTPAAPSQTVACGLCQGSGVLGPTQKCICQYGGQEPVALTDSYAGVIAWIGDKQCKLLVTEDAIKHEHTPGVVMRNTAHQCVQEVIIAALREKQGGV